MSRSIFISVIALALVVACGGRVEAARRGKRNISSNGEFSFQLESHGRRLPTYNHHGRTYVEGRWGQHYQIRVFNHTSRRVETVVTVDGRNAVSGQVGDYRSQRGYVIQPWGSVLIDGFRTSSQRVAAFRFTEVGGSYAARMGDASNVGVVGVAVFKERTYRPKPRPPIVPYYDYESRRHSSKKKGRSEQGLGTGYGRGAGAMDEAPATSRSAPDMDDLSSAKSGGGGDGYRARASRRPAHRQGIGTEYGHDTYSPSERTSFTRRNSGRPSAILAVRYDDREGLMALGVVPRPRPPRPIYRHRPPKPDPFPRSPEPGYAPPPPPAYYWD
jgi:hypothetical protein